MHPRALAEQSDLATKDIRAAAGRLAATVGRDDLLPLLDAPYAHDPAVRDLFQRQAVAAFLTALADASEGGRGQGERNAAPPLRGDSEEKPATPKRKGAK